MTIINGAKPNIFMPLGQKPGFSDTLQSATSNSQSVFGMDSPLKNQLKLKQEELKKLKKRLNNASKDGKDAIKRKMKRLEAEIKNISSMVEADNMFNNYMLKLQDNANVLATKPTGMDTLAARPTKKVADFIGDGSYNKEAGSSIASTAAKEANKLSRTGMCYRGVKNTLLHYGVSLNGGSAYEAASQLATNTNFREVKVTREELSTLPQGAIVVWDKSPGHQHGHISISLGNGMEASDHIQKQMNRQNATYRVFLPSGNFSKYA